MTGGGYEAATARIDSLVVFEPVRVSFDLSSPTTNLIRVDPGARGRLRVRGKD